MTTITVDANSQLPKKNEMKLIVSLGGSRTDNCIVLPLTIELIELFSKAESVERVVSWDGVRKYTYVAKNYLDLHIVQETSIAPVPVLIEREKANTEES